MIGSAPQQTPGIPLPIPAPRRRAIVSQAPPRNTNRIVALVQMTTASLLGLFFLLPLLWMVSTALKTDLAAVTDRNLIPQELTTENFRRLLHFGGDTPVIRWFLNSLAASVLGTSITLVLCGLSGYAFARLSFRGRDALFGLLVLSFLLPPIILLVPQFLLVTHFGLYNSIAAFILPGIASAFGVFFLRQFFLGFPRDLEEAARLDGAGTFRIFWSIALPLSLPAFATLAMISFLAYWNDYLWPLVVCEGAGCTLSPGLANFQSQNNDNYGILMAGSLVAAVPTFIVFIVAQRWVIRSVAHLGLKE